MPARPPCSYDVLRRDVHHAPDGLGGERALRRRKKYEVRAGVKLGLKGAVDWPGGGDVAGSRPQQTARLLQPCTRALVPSAPPLTPLPPLAPSR